MFPRFITDRTRHSRVVRPRPPRQEALGPTVDHDILRVTSVKSNPEPVLSHPLGRPSQRIFGRQGPAIYRGDSAILI